MCWGRQFALDTIWYLPLFWFCGVVKTIKGNCSIAPRVKLNYFLQVYMATIFKIKHVPTSLLPSAAK